MRNAASIQQRWVEPKLAARVRLNGPGWRESSFGHTETLSQWERRLKPTPFSEKTLAGTKGQRKSLGNKGRPKNDAFFARELVVRRTEIVYE